MTYGDKYDKNRYSIYRFYRDVRRNARVRSQIGRHYPNVLDHVVLEDCDLLILLIVEIAQSPLVDDAVASIQRFASRCWATDKSQMLVNMMSQALDGCAYSKPISDALLSFGAKLDPRHFNNFTKACRYTMHDVMKHALENGQYVNRGDVLAVIESGNRDAMQLVFSAYRESIDLHYTRVRLDNVTVQSLELCMSLNIIQRGRHYEFSNIPSFSVLQWILDHDVMKHDEVLIDIASNASCYSGHYFDMLRYLIEQRNFTVPRDVLLEFALSQAADLDVFDYLLWHGADVNALDEDGNNVLECSPMLLRYWIDKRIVIKSNDANVVVACMMASMTVTVLEMMIDKYSLNVNIFDREGWTALHWACSRDKYEIVEMLLRHGAEVNKRHAGQAPCDMTSDDRIKQLLDKNQETRAC